MGFSSLKMEIILLSELSQTERKVPYDLTFMWNLKNKTNGQTEQKQTYREQNCWLPEGSQVK